MAQDEQVLTARVVQEKLGISRPTLLRYIASGNLKSIRKGKLIYIYKDSFDQWIKRAETPAAKVIACANHKGGVAKTTTLLYLAQVLAKAGKKVLLIDLDPQSNLSFFYLRNQELIDSECPAEWLFTKSTDAQAIRNLGKKHTVANFGKLGLIDLISSNLDLSYSVAKVPEVGRDRVLHTALTHLKDLYDFVLVDCPPNLQFLTINGVTAADLVLIPVAPDLFSQQGLRALVKVIESAEVGYGRPIASAIILTKVNSSTNAYKAAVESLQKSYKDRLWDISMDIEQGVVNDQFKGTLTEATKTLKVTEKLADKIAKRIAQQGGAA